MVEDLKKAVEESLKMSEEELKKTLPTIMEGIKGNVGQLMEAVPDLMPKLARRLEEIDVAKFTSEAPEASAKFTDVFWEGISIMAEKDPEIRKKLEGAGEIKVNFEATDSPMKGHEKISAEKISGSSTPLETYDLKIKGPTKVLVGLITGSVDPVRGFMGGQYKLEGSLALGMKLASVITSLGKKLKGGS